MRGIGVRGAPEAATQGRSRAGLRFSPAELRSPTWAEETPRASGEEGHPSLGGPDLAVTPGSDQQCPASVLRFKAPSELWLPRPPLILKPWEGEEGLSMTYLFYRGGNGGTMSL